MQPFQFFDERQAKIYKRLANIGAGPAAFFRDACAMMDGDLVLEARSHLVSHALREVESALRDVLEPLADQSDQRIDSSSTQPQRDSVLDKLNELGVSAADPVAQAWLDTCSTGAESGSNHRMEVIAILNGLGILPSDPVGKAWLRLVGKLHGKAHRDALMPPRPIDADYRAMWSSVQDILDVVLDRYERRYAEVYDLLDVLVVKPAPEPGDLDMLRNTVPNNFTTYGYFFERLQSPDWLIPLRTKGFFRMLPVPIRDTAEGTIRFPSWPAGAYLARAASSEPQVVIDIIREIKSDNPRVHDELAKAALALPPNKAAKIVPLTVPWLAIPYQQMTPGLLCKLVVRLSEANEVDAALELTRQLLTLTEHSHANEVPSHRRTPRARFWDYEYEKFLKDGIPSLVAVSGMNGLRLLCDTLDQAFLISYASSHNRARDYSEVCRPAIEDHPQNEIPWGLVGYLITAIRDAAEQVLKVDTILTPSIVELFAGYGWNVFQRLALHVLRLTLDAHTDLARTYILNKERFLSRACWHEYTLLVNAAVPSLTPSDRSLIAQWIDDGPDTQEESTSEEGESAVTTAVQRATYQRAWQLEHAIRLKDVLPEEWKERNKELFAEASQAEHPDFLNHIESWIGPTSPKAAIDLTKMSTAETISYLKTWQPTGDFMTPSWEGLARELTAAVQADAVRFSNEAASFRELSEPTYVNGVLRGFYEAAKGRLGINWSTVLDLCDWASTRPRSIPGRRQRESDRDPDWGWTRQTIASFLEVGFQTNAIGASEQSRVRDILMRLLEDPDPTPRHEAEYGGSNMDPATLSLNTVRGRATHAFLQYAFWLKRLVSNETDAQARPALETAISEAWDEFDVLLDPDREPSASVRAVFGWHFAGLVWLDAKEAEARLPSVFPPDDEQMHLWLAAWGSFLLYGQSWRAVFPVMVPVYDHAVARLRNRGQDIEKDGPVEQLATRILWLYGFGAIERQPDGLLSNLFEWSALHIRSHAIQEIGHYLHESKESPKEDVLARFQEFCVARIALDSGRGAEPEELAAFGSWFASPWFAGDWEIEQLRHCLKAGIKVEPYHWILERLVALSEKLPQECVECLHLLDERDERGWDTALWHEEKEVIFKNALSSEDSGAVEAARDTINRLCAVGETRYRGLLKPDA